MYQYGFSAAVASESLYGPAQILALGWNMPGKKPLHRPKVVPFPSAPPNPLRGNENPLRDKQDRTLAFPVTG